MAISILKKYHRNALSILLLILSPILVFFLPFKIFWVYHAIILVIVIFENRGIARTKYYHLLLFFLIPIFWSFLYSVYLNASSYSIIQSLYYLFIPPIFVAIGMQYGRTISKEDLFKYILFSGTSGTIVFIIYGSVRLGVSGFTDIESIRRVLVWGPIMSILSVIVLLFSKYDGVFLIKSKGIKTFLLLLNIAGIILTASRTYYLMLLIFLLLFLLIYQRKWFAIIGIIISILVIQLINVETDNSFIQKIQNSFTELFNESEFAGYNTANQYYRSYESSMAYETYKKGNEFELIFGHGLEKLVDLKQYILLGDVFRKEIPITHNGYPFMLIRFGTFGFISYFLFFAFVLLKKLIKRMNSFLYILLVGISVSLIMSNFVIYGFFNLEIALLWSLLGAIIVYTEKKQ